MLNILLQLFIGNHSKNELKANKTGNNVNFIGGAHKITTPRLDYNHHCYKQSVFMGRILFTNWVICRYFSCVEYLHKIPLYFFRKFYYRMRELGTFTTIRYGADKTITGQNIPFCDFI